MLTFLYYYIFILSATTPILCEVCMEQFQKNNLKCVFIREDMENSSLRVYLFLLDLCLFFKSHNFTTIKQLLYVFFPTFFLIVETLVYNIV